MILITGLVPGYPNPNLSLEIAKTLRKAGADILELSASFSEPIADGPTLQLAHQRTLANGFTKAQAFALYKKIKEATHAPLFLIEYANVIYQTGFDKYYAQAADAGINYVLVPDVPLEESPPFIEAAKRHEIAHIFMIAPTTPVNRAQKIIETAKTTINKNASPQTFLYLVSVTGVTGSRKSLTPETLDFIKRIRGLTDLPLIIGFGISRNAHVREVLNAGGDGIVTCSPIVDIIHNLQDQPSAMIKAIESYVRGLTIVKKNES